MLNEPGKKRQACVLRVREAVSFLLLLTSNPRSYYCPEYIKIIKRPCLIANLGKILLMKGSVVKASLITNLLCSLGRFLNILVCQGPHL